VPTAKELAEKARYFWTCIPTHDHVPNQRLRLELDGSYGTGQAKWADRRTWMLRGEAAGDPAGDRCAR